MITWRQRKTSIIFILCLCPPSSSFKTQTHTHTHQISPIRVLNSLHGSRLGHNILLFVERLSSCVTSAKNTTPPLPTPPSQLSLPPSLPACSAHIVFLYFSVWSAGGEGRGGEARVGGTLIQGVLLTSAGREWCHCDVNACNCNRAAKLTGVHSDSERELRGKREKEEEETL